MMHETTPYIWAGGEVESTATCAIDAATTEPAAAAEPDRAAAAMGWALLPRKKCFFACTYSSTRYAPVAKVSNKSALPTILHVFGFANASLSRS